MSSTAANRSRGVRVLGLLFAALFVLLCVAALIAYLGFQGKPEHWEAEQNRIAELPEANRLSMSESLRNRLLRQWSDPGEKTPVTEVDLFGHRQRIEIQFDELNTWIKTEGLELLEAIEIQVPESATTAMVDSPGGGLLRISFEVTTEDIRQVITLSFAITVAEDGTLTSTLKQASAGKLPLPVSTAISIIASQADDGILLDLMRGDPIAPIELPIDPSKDGVRDGRIVALEVTDAALIITRETVQRQKK
jgi:hypothetical protein